MNTHLLLASASEWRAKLLQQAGIDFEVMPTDIDEETDKQAIADPETLVKVLAEKKALACLNQFKNSTGLNQIILSADTIIFLNNKIIGKPKDRNHAREIISMLSGKTHQVWTGVCLIEAADVRSQTSGLKKTILAERSDVTVRTMTYEEVEAFLDTNEWVGKAGGYQIQKTLGKYITRVVGSYSNIIGLPLLLINRNVNNFGSH